MDLPFLSPLVLLAACSAPSSPAPLAPAPPATAPTAQASAAPATAAPCKSLPAAATAPYSEPSDRGLLSAGLDAPLAGEVQSKHSFVNAVPAPFLVHGKIWELLYDTYHPKVVHLGQIDGQPTVVLSSAAVFLDFARRAGLALDDDARQAAYLREYLSLDPRYLAIVEAPSGIPFTAPRSMPDTEETKQLFLIDPGARGEMERGIAKRREVEERHAAAIKPLCLVRGALPVRGVVHAIASGALVRLELTLDPGGAVATREVVLATDLPLPFVMR
jgi:hypothetical protein